MTNDQISAQEMKNAKYYDELICDLLKNHVNDDITKESIYLLLLEYIFGKKV